jgi:CRISP-associated protein Cas1
MSEQPLISVAALHALAYCERLFYLEEVERIRLADAAVYGGRELHERLAADEEGAVERLFYESELLGVRGALDVLRRRDGTLIPYEHKRGRSAGEKGDRTAWNTDRIQLGAYTLLVEEARGVSILEARIRYHADGVTVRVAIDDELRTTVKQSIARAQELRASIERPPITTNERLCVRCSLAPVCLPEETRLVGDPALTPLRLMPQHPAGQTIHVTEQGASVGRSGNELRVRSKDGSETRIPVVEGGTTGASRLRPT